ncbi:MAG: 1-(5-phosphoribosyl)-5-[(5-phosphoribosylamino)methylideneamino]imidazole-4-carboxamide isomerase [Sphingobacteriaceae bacterium]|nr:1-(5-phosphoribosyl)-5-[(5-phosphoribosylamino)methylideneamino]imidazole-4-carboxamide isomerase [Sphingobacteriaceae bacterium]
MQIIPAIDIIEGKCVRLTQGDYNQKIIYNENPLEVAKRFEDIGLSRLHLVDLDGAKKGEVVNSKVLESIASKTSLVIDFGGGIKTQRDIENVFNSGAQMATIGSLAVKNPFQFQKWIKEFGSDKIMLGADVRDESIAISGWLEKTELNIFDFIQSNKEFGLKQFFCTDVSKDGMLEGPSIELYKKIINKYPDLNFIASGGVSCYQDLVDLKEIGCKGVIVGKAIYEGKISLEEINGFK